MCSVLFVYHNQIVTVDFNHKVITIIGININIQSLNYLKGLNTKPHLSSDSIDYEGLAVSLTRNNLSKRNGDQGLR